MGASGYEPTVLCLAQRPTFTILHSAFIISRSFTFSGGFTPRRGAAKSRERRAATRSAPLLHFAFIILQFYIFRGVHATTRSSERHTLSTPHAAIDAALHFYIKDSAFTASILHYVFYILHFITLQAMPTFTFSPRAVVKRRSEGGARRAEGELLQRRGAAKLPSRDGY